MSEDATRYSKYEGWGRPFVSQTFQPSHILPRTHDKKASNKGCFQYDRFCPPIGSFNIIIISSSRRRFQLLFSYAWRSLDTRKPTKIQWAATMGCSPLFVNSNSRNVIFMIQNSLMKSVLARRRFLPMSAKSSGRKSTFDVGQDRRSSTGSPHP
jgi:hypothetical protein